MIKSLTVASVLSLALGGAALAQGTTTGAPPGSAPLTQAPIAPADQNGARMENGGSVMAPWRHRHMAQRHHRHVRATGETGGAM